MILFDQRTQGILKIITIKRRDRMCFWVVEILIKKVRIIFFDFKNRKLKVFLYQTIKLLIFMMIAKPIPTLISEIIK
jgi:hypothetical protein